MRFRRLRDDDSLEALTDLIHRAYAPHAARGLKFVGTWQTVEITRDRVALGECWVHEHEGRIAATFVLVPPGRVEPNAPHYARAGVAKLNQVAVDPDLQRRGIGSAMMAFAEDRARELGASELALDTAVHADGLLAFYGSRGYRFVEHVDWRPGTNYVSAILSLDLAGGSTVRHLRPYARPAHDGWADPGTAAGIDALFQRVWPGLPAQIALAAELGWPWRTISTPFVSKANGVVAAHVGVLQIPVVLDGKSVVVAGIHAVATDPSLRGAGHGRAAMAAALAHVDERHAIVWLTTSIPKYFEPFGFRTLPESLFRVPDPRPGTAPALRRLSHRAPADRALLKRCVEHRAVLSDLLSVRDGGWLLGINEIIAYDGFGSLHAADDLEVIVAWRRQGSTAVILDVIGPTLPALDAVVARLPADVREVVLAFAPDRFDPSLEPVRGSPDGETVWMVRGRWKPDGPLALPFHGRC